MVTPDRAREEEGRRIRLARLLSDLTLTLIQTQPHLSREQAYALMEGLRRKIVKLFPDKGSVFDLVLRPRLERAIRSRFYLC